MTASRERKEGFHAWREQNVIANVETLQVFSHVFVAHCCPVVYISAKQMRSKPHSIWSVPEEAKWRWDRREDEAIAGMMGAITLVCILNSQ